MTPADSAWVYRHLLFWPQLLCLLFPPWDTCAESVSVHGSLSFCWLSFLLCLLPSLGPPGPFAGSLQCPCSGGSFICLWKGLYQRLLLQPLWLWDDVCAPPGLAHPLLLLLCSVRLILDLAVTSDIADPGPAGFPHTAALATLIPLGTPPSC